MIFRILWQADPNQAKTNDGATALICASHGASYEPTTFNDPSTPPQLGHTEVIRLLLDHNADPNQRKVDNGAAPLLFCCQDRNIEAVRLLLDRGANPAVATKNDGMTPLMAAAQQNCPTIVRILLVCRRRHGLLLSFLLSPFFCDAVATITLGFWR